MKKTTQIILTANEGMYLTDGNEYVTEIRLPETADQSVWHEITEEEYAKIVAEQEELFNEQSI